MWSECVQGIRGRVSPYVRESQSVRVTLFCYFTNKALVQHYDSQHCFVLFRVLDHIGFI